MSNFTEEEDVDDTSSQASLSSEMSSQEPATRPPTPSTSAAAKASSSVNVNIIDVSKGSDFSKKHGGYSSKAKRDANAKQQLIDLFKADNKETNALLNKLPQAAMQKPAEPDDEETLFCKSLAMQMKGLPPAKRALAKLQVQELMYNIQYAAPALPPSPISQFSMPLQSFASPNYNNTTPTHIPQHSSFEYEYQSM